MIDYRILVQARMSSSRFPGKVLAPMGGCPMIAHVLGRLAECSEHSRVLLVTSDDPTDDPLADYVEGRLGVEVFRGSLDDVVKRFQSALVQYPTEWFVRICGDSPALDPGLLEWMLARLTPDVDLMSNVVRRTFPPGQSIEILRTSRFLAIDSATLAADEQEHLTLCYYRHPEDYRISAVESADAELTKRRQVVDTIEDMHNLTHIMAVKPEMTRGYADHARVIGADA